MVSGGWIGNEVDGEMIDREGGGEWKERVIY